MRVNKYPSALYYSPEEQEHLGISQKHYLSVNTQQELSQAFDRSRQQGLFSLPPELLQHSPPGGEGPLCEALQPEADHQLLQHPH